MPSRNVDKIDVDESFYHVYARGVSKQDIFLDDQDYRYFLGTFERYLSEKPACDKLGNVYPHYKDQIDLVTYCCMKNHFHLLVYQVEVSSMGRLMQSVMTSYSRYFNLKYKRSGPVFESRYKASLISSDVYLQHITRYIHLNPRSWRRYKYSSLRYYLGDVPPVWLRPQRVVELFDFDDAQDYKEFVSDYEENKRMLDDLKDELADA